MEVEAPASIVCVYTPLVVPEYRRYPTTAGSESGSQARVTSARRKPGAITAKAIYMKAAAGLARERGCIAILLNI